MKTFGLTLAAVLALFQALSAEARTPAPVANIIGGSQDVEHHFLLGLMEEGGRGPFCGATVIDPGLAVTAGHCLKLKSRDLWVVESGDWSRRQFDAQRAKVLEVEIHPDYLHGDQGADIALIRFDQNFLTTSASDLSLNSISVEQPAAAPVKAQVLGWGSRSSYGNLTPSAPQVAMVPVISDQDCRELGGRYGRLSPHQLCAGYLETGGIDSCHGDSGGPLFVADSAGLSHLIGVVSWGESCAQAGRPGVYTKVAPFLDWINTSRGRKPVIGGDPTSAEFVSLVNRRCYQKLFSKLTESRDEDVLNVFTHVREVENITISNVSPSHFEGNPTCEINTEFGQYKYFAKAPSPQSPDQETGTLIESATGRSFDVQLKNSIRGQLTCKLRPPTNGDPMLIADDEKLMVRWHGNFYEPVPDLDASSGDITPLDSSNDTGCAVGTFSIRMIGVLKVANTDSPVAEIRAPILGETSGRVVLRRVERMPFMELTFVKKDGHQGTVELHNPTNADLLNWRLDCNHHLTFESVTSWPSGSEFEDGSHLSHEYSTGSSPWSRISRGSTLRFAYRSESPFGVGTKAVCTINGVPMTVSDRPLN